MTEFICQTCTRISMNVRKWAPALGSECIFCWMFGCPRFNEDLNNWSFLKFLEDVGWSATFISEPSLHQSDCPYHWWLVPGRQRNNLEPKGSVLNEKEVKRTSAEGEQDGLLIQGSTVRWFSFRAALGYFLLINKTTKQEGTRFFSNRVNKGAQSSAGRSALVPALKEPGIQLETNHRRASTALFMVCYWFDSNKQEMNLCWNF